MPGPRPGGARRAGSSTCPTCRATTGSPTSTTPWPTVLDGHANPLFYLAIPPVLFDDVVQGLGRVGVADSGRVVVEKPFGRDAASAKRAQRLHPLGLPRGRASSASTTTSARSRSRTCWSSASPTRCSSRCGTATSSPACRSPWPRTSASGSRGKFYESVGALRDVLQNHLLQVVALLGMEPPAGADADVAARREGEAAAPGAHDRPRRRGPRPVPRATSTRRASRAAPTSRPTSPCASRSTRGAGPACPWLIRTGKALAVAGTEAIITFNAPPRLLFTPEGAPEPGPEPPPLPAGQGRRREAPPHAKKPGDELIPEPIDLDVSYAEALGPREEAYQRLLDDAMDGDARRFGREDALDEQWRIVEQVLEHHDEVHLYAPGSMGPERGRRPRRRRRRLARPAPRRSRLRLRRARPVGSAGMFVPPCPYPSASGRRRPGERAAGPPARRHRGRAADVARPGDHRRRSRRDAERARTLATGRVQGTLGTGRPRAAGHAVRLGRPVRHRPRRRADPVHLRDGRAHP